MSTKVQWLYALYRQDGGVLHAAVYEMTERAAFRFGARIPAARRPRVVWKPYVKASSAERRAAARTPRSVA